MAYPGGKGGAYQQIINRIPPHRVYVESHLGAGAVLKKKIPAVHSIGIDLDFRMLGKIEPRDNFTGLCGDAAEILPQLGLGHQDFLYCDPPYLPETRKRKRLYRFEATEYDHHRLLAVILKLPCQIMISGYGNSLYERLLSEWRSESFTVASQTGRRTETVWMNYTYEAPFDTRYIGKNFREREMFRRKRLRWRKQFEKLPEVHRRALLSDLQSEVMQSPAEERLYSPIANFELFEQLPLPGLQNFIILSKHKEGFKTP